MESPPKSAPHRSLVLATQAQDSRHADLRAALARAGFRIDSTGFDEAAHNLRSNAPDLVLIDACESASAALTLCQQLREETSTRTTPIVILHDAASPEWVAEACEAGASEMLEKGLPGALLESRLDGAILHVARLLDDSLLNSDPLGQFGSSRLLAASSAFPQLVSVAIDQCRSTDNIVCVLAVRCNDASQDRLQNSDGIATQLSRAVREFEQEGRISHPKGHIVITRLDGDCFALLLPELGRIQDAARLGYKIHDCLSQGAGGGMNAIHVGIATSPGDSNQGSELTRLALSAAAFARQSEGSHLNFHTASTNRWVFERLTLERSLRNSIERDELVVYYQPKVNISTLDLIGFEALVRWQHPELGMVSPAQFIPLAEETGLIVPIGEWVLETACRQVKLWEASGLEPVRMAVNLSPVQFRKQSLCETVAKILERTGLPPALLELEVTESMLMHNLKNTINTLQRLKATGIYLSIDDFGTGYSSLSYLKGFPIDALKIDSSFIRDITSKSDDAAIATSIILMGKSLNLHVIAEGVETERQRAFLEVLQCNEMQGYLFSPPVPADKAETFMTRRA